jgi:hypothetical protein
VENKMTKKEIFFKFGKEVALLQCQMKFSKDSIEEGKQFDDQKRIEFEQGKITSHSHQITGIIRMAEQFGFNHSDVFLLASNLSYEYNFNEIYAMTENPYNPKKKRSA